MFLSSVGVSSLVSSIDRLKPAPLSSASSFPQDEIDRIVEDVKDVARKWQRIQALLADAEERQIREKSVRLCLCELRDLANEIADLRDACEYELVAREVLADRAASSSKRRNPNESDRVEVRSSMDSSLSPLADASFWQNIARDVDRINKLFDSIAEGRKGLELKEADGYKLIDRGIRGRKPTGYLIPTDSVFVGRDDELKEMRKLVCAVHNGDAESNVEVIAVIGMGGAGKTTLAQHLYDVEDGFDVKKWVHVPQNSDETGLMRAIVESFTGKPCSLTQLGTMQEELQRCVQDKRVLLVTDDLWLQNLEQWKESVVPIIKHAKGGSKILITTRREDVAQRANAMAKIDVGKLPEKVGWDLLKKHAFLEDADIPQELEQIGKGIVKKSGGLPLSIRVLGGLLRDRGDDVEDWRNVLESSLLDYRELDCDGVREAGEIIGSLYLS